ncbi:MAG: hypothetical protein KA257_02415 [Opitutaceae bacterium]|nr:hypothetical protein [Opitutaceae bacterium]MBP9912997.1 hypothetical protein [Opitutaceae bacterium]
MPRLARFIPLLLLALWLPATLHCDLATAGLAPESMACENEHTPDSQAADNCDLVEHSAYKSTSLSLKATAPTLCACLGCLVENPAETSIVLQVSPARSDSPPELIPTWSFRHRAALPVRAPASVA